LNMPKARKKNLTTTLSQLHALQRSGVIRALDYQFAVFIYQLLMKDSAPAASLLIAQEHCSHPEAIQPHTEATQHNDAPLLWLAALVSFQLGAGHGCIQLSKLPRPFFALPNESKNTGADAQLPDTMHLLALLKASPVVRCINDAQDDSAQDASVAPLCLEGDRLYLYRYWFYEQQVATRLRAMLATEKEVASIPLLRPLINTLFVLDENNPWPRLAAALALNNRLLMITGGPGTGKTTTVTRILALLLEQANSRQQRLSIQLAAPTGKAAARLSESISTAKVQLPVAAAVLAAIPDQATTLHRLLGTVPQSQHFRFNRHNPLHLDVLLIDEASMIDLPMMFALLEALPVHARLILLGDKDQLSSVEPGSVLADLCAHANDKLSLHTSAYVQQCIDFTPGVDASLPETALANSVCQLKKSYRFSEHGAIGHVARLVNAGQASALDAYLQVDSAQSDVAFFPLSEAESCLQTVVLRYREFILACRQGGGQAEAVLQAFSRFQVLCATREGVFGVNDINQRVEDALYSQGLIKQRDYYIGCPIMITQNSYTHQLYNGDIGVVLADSDNQQHLRVYFPALNSLADKTPRKFLLSRLPVHEKAFAMTVHKSQGSEFDEIMIIYPKQDSPVLTRELLYTAITRAKTHCLVLADYAVLQASIKRKTRRDSGLADKLR